MSGSLIHVSMADLLYIGVRNHICIYWNGFPQDWFRIVLIFNYLGKMLFLVLSAFKLLIYIRLARI